MRDVMLVALTLVLGALLSSVSLCAVAGMQQTVATGNFEDLERLGLAALARGLTALTHWRTPMSAATLCAGAIGASVFAGRFQLQRPTPSRPPRCLAGGGILGSGAALIPGGNDRRLLWGIPGLTVYGVLAIGLMLRVMRLDFFPGGRWPRPAAGPLAPAQ